MGWGLVLALGISILIFVLIFHVMRKLMPLVLHGIFGFAVFWLFGAMGILKVPLDIITFLIAAFGGVLGVLVALLLAALGVPL